MAGRLAIGLLGCSSSVVRVDLVGVGPPGTAIVLAMSAESRPSRFAIGFAEPGHVGPGSRDRHLSRGRGRTRAPGSGRFARGPPALGVALWCAGQPG